MFWPVVVPFQITCCVLLCIIVVATIAAPLVKWRCLPTFFGVGTLCLICFVPLCGAIMKTMDAKRFGVFRYSIFADVQDFRVERYLPSVATNITVDKYAQGFRAKFTISQTELDAFMDDMWDKHGNQSTVARGEMSAMDTIDADAHLLIYGDLGWDHLANATEVFGPTAGNGAGFSIWFSAEKKIAYQRAGYW